MLNSELKSTSAFKYLMFNCSYFLYNKGVIVTGPINPDSRGKRSEASNIPFFVLWRNLPDRQLYPGFKIYQIM